MMRVTTKSILVAVLAASVAIAPGNSSAAPPPSAEAAITTSLPADAPAATTPRARLARFVRAKLLGRGVPNDEKLKAVIAAIADVARHRLVPPHQAPQAYEAAILPIGHGQTSTDPEYVGYMTALLRLAPSDHILEIGTGSGYQAAVLGEIVADVRTIEIVEPLAASATANLAALGYDNIHVRHGNGYAGWPEFAPYDAVTETAGATCLPPALIAQLKPGGRMAIPLGQSIASERLVLLTKRADGGFDAKAYGETMFVDFTGRIQRSTPLLRFRRGGIDVRNLWICDA